MIYSLPLFLHGCNYYHSDPGVLPLEYTHPGITHSANVTLLMAGLGYAIYRFSKFLDKN